MLVIALVASEKLPALRGAFSHVDWQMWEVNEFMLGGDWVTRIVIQCDEMPPDEFDVPIEAVFQEPKYCHVCSKKLQPNNSSGYCRNHRDKDPKRSARKRRN